MKSGRAAPQRSSRRQFCTGLGAGTLGIIGIGTARAAAPDLAAIAEAELAAMATRLRRQGPSAGAMLCYFAPEAGNLVSPYAAQVALLYALRAYHGTSPPAALTIMAGAYLNFALDKLMWALEPASAPGRDAAGTGYGAGRLLMRLRDGTILAIPDQYRYPASPAAPARLYSPAQMRQVAHNVSALFVKACPLTQYVRAQDGLVLPGWVLNQPDMSFQTPLDQITGATYQDIHDSWYDATDSYAATLVSLAACWLRSQTEAVRRDWLARNIETLRAVMDAALATQDSGTGLTIATPYSRAAYTLDNIEVWRGLRDFCGLLRLAPTLEAAPAALRAEMSSALPLYSAKARQLRADIDRFCRLPGNSGPGLFVPGWNVGAKAILTPYPANKPAFLDAFSFTFLNDYPAFSGNAAARTRYFSAMRTQGLPAPEPDRPPDLWRYLVAAAAPVQDAPFPRAALLAWVARITAQDVRARQRDWRSWWIAESGALIWLCQLLSRPS